VGVAQSADEGERGGMIRFHDADGVDW
jgi:hypothetical protein